MDKNFLIISGGDYEEFGNPGNAFVIACDKGYEYAVRSGIIPDLIIGDFDSYSGELPENIEIMRLPKEKDDTDTMFAVKEAIKRGAESIRIVCALGARKDHEFANIQSLAYAVSNGADALISSKHTIIYAVRNGNLTINAFPGQDISVFSLSDISKGVTIKGTHYDVQGIELTNSMPLGQSNRAENDTVSISVEHGILIVMQSR